ncbi:MAG: chain length determinant protein tyrosine kinase EpsG [Rhodoferax sp.]|nr:chain length determinant protein tyrosine kinase EpsG [Rhodoferax sp.]
MTEPTTGPVESGNVVATGHLRSIGDILVSHGKLSPTDLQRILERQNQDKLPFGEAAITLKLLEKKDIDFALSRQFDYAYLPDSDRSLSPELVSAYQPFSRVGENLRAVRSQLMLRWFNAEPHRKALAVVSPGSAEGRSFVAANLAIVFAQQGQRTLLIDADLRAKPARSQQALFKLGPGAGLSGILSGRAGLEAAQQVPGLPGLAVLPAGAVPPNPQELLGRAGFMLLVQEAAEQVDVILIDTPEGNAYADAEIVSARAGAALMISRKNQSLVHETTELANRLKNNGVALVGYVLNDA